MRFLSFTLDHSDSGIAELDYHIILGIDPFIDLLFHIGHSGIAQFGMEGAHTRSTSAGGVQGSLELALHTLAQGRFAGHRLNAAGMLNMGFFRLKYVATT